MNDPIMPPFLTLLGIALIFWGGLRLRRSFRKRGDAPRFNWLAGPQLEATFTRASKTFDNISLLLVGILLFAFGFLDLLSQF
jgi:hypothetical protein